MATRESSVSPNIVLTGFMGVGKTAVGRTVAQRLERPFIDLDDRIVAETGMRIPEIFDQHGEAYFRVLEAKVLRQLAGEQGLVIATGGGALVDRRNRELVTRTSLVICLSASVSAIEDRVGRDLARPLLAGADRRQRIVALLNERAAAYAEIPYRIDTTAKTIDQVAEEVIRLAQQGLGGILRLPVRSEGNPYDILIGSHLLEDLPDLLAGRELVGPPIVITDETVAEFWLEHIMSRLAQTGASPIAIVLPVGEAHKRLDTVRRIYDDLIAAEIDRSGVIIALGGGVVSDMAGFAAATYMRGIRFVVVPTTLLAMVDASVGGKTGVDLPQGKNLVGAFKQPDLVIIDPEVLSTLPAAEFRQGLAEVVKHGIIADPELFVQLQGDGPDSLQSMLAQALRVKIQFVEKDPLESGERAYLNLGHTFAHAFEQVSAYGIPHGEAVSVGLAASAYLAALRGDCSPQLPLRIIEVLERLGLPITLSGLSTDAVIAAMATDKKRIGKTLRFILPHEIGSVAMHDDVTPEQLKDTLQRVLVDPS